MNQGIKTEPQAAFAQTQVGLGNTPIVSGEIANAATALDHNNKRLAELLHCLGDHCMVVCGYNPIHDMQSDKRDTVPPQQSGAIYDLKAQLEIYENLLPLLNGVVDKIGEL